jgi:cysteine desulfurase/selenocysteine lyase
MHFDVSVIRRQFPLLEERIEGKTIVYLDNAATTQKPHVVLDAMMDFYMHRNANVNRGVHPLAEAATTAYDAARKTVQSFLNAKHSHEILFTRNATEAINLVARSWGASLTAKDTIAVSIAEHHSNIVPWQQTKGNVAWISLTDDGQMDLKSLENILGKKVKMVAMTGLSNVLGSMTPLKKAIDMAHAHGALVLIDAAQLAAHAVIDVQALDADFLVFSGHKIYGPLGIGVLYGKSKLLSAMPPFLGGGDMIGVVKKTGFTAAELPRKFEAGTPAIADAVGLAAAVQWMESIGRESIASHERMLLEYAMQQLKKINGLSILGSATEHHSCISFTVSGAHPHDLTELMGRSGVCVRAGHHCTQPLHEHLGINASVRLSVAAYNTLDDIDRCVASLKDAYAFLTK